MSERMPRLAVVALVVWAALAGCRRSAIPTATAPASDAPFPATWTPTLVPELTLTATKVIRPTPTWDGTPPAPSKASVPRLPPDQLYRALHEGKGIAVDVRSFVAYEQVHIPDAVNIPLRTLAERANELDGDDLVILYDLSVSQIESLEAAMILYGLGFAHVAVLEGGIQQWYIEGYPLDGTWLTPTPSEPGPPWTLTPLATSSVPATISATETVTSTLARVTATKVAATKAAGQ